MFDLADEVRHVLSRVEELACRSVSVSKYGALQLGFGEAVDYVIAGKYVKKRYQIELGTYGSAWVYELPDCHCPQNEESLASDILGKHVASIGAGEGGVVLTFASAGVFRIGSNGEADDVFYLHVSGGPSVFLHSVDGWSLERS
jgi:hypothetical protein